MPDDLIAKAIAQIAEHAKQADFHRAESVRLKNWVNDADRLAGNEPRFPDVDLTQPLSPINVIPALMRSSTKPWAAGDFLGKPFATAAKTILQVRYDAVGKPAPATVDEIHDALLQGAYDFGPGNADQQKRGISIALGKNTAVFVRLPNSDLFGLLEWYPGLKRTTRVRARLDQPTSGDQPASTGSAGDEEAAEPPAAREVRRA
jgi:hypothetical protein